MGEDTDQDYKLRQCLETNNWQIDDFRRIIQNEYV